MKGAALFDRVAIDLGGQGASALPTDERLQRVADGAVDPLLLRPTHLQNVPAHPLLTRV